eukprot:CAMPEP_0172307668 /NCGR_PEP_ID=MMETSP1058-20130122/8475_1 /TAXON_ID=83371 /ORGANISM="Detonula confervacea, Strain CCMP 353" /LENGTH=210 /DNA_ID=CAMNT_0013019893 /DNA_START=374 /DNA_END=1002 /DNA_ORIENTATION=-
MKSYLQHGKDCMVKATGGCNLCKQIWSLLKMHAQQCNNASCLIPQCIAIRNDDAIRSPGYNLLGQSPILHAMSNATNHGTRPALNNKNAHDSTATRPPFFQLYDNIMAKLSSAEQSNDAEATEFYGYLKEWFVRKTEEEDFKVSNFDSAPVEERALYFDTSAKRLITAKLEGRDANVEFINLSSGASSRIVRKNFMLLPSKLKKPAPSYV